MGEAVWLPNPPEAEWHGLHKHWPNVEAWLPSMARVVVVLLQQRDDQLKIAFPWMEVRILPLVTY